jgi:SAM-dependent methyltransferase
MEKSDYWIDFWKNYGKESKEDDPQKQVLRTINQDSISEELWKFTVKEIEEQIEPNIDDRLLELCCGNGLISRYFSPLCKHITSVDVSEDLVALIDKNQYSNIEPIVSDIRNLDFTDKVFSKVIIYAGIQYLTLSESVILLEKVFRWLKPGGCIFLGDIPNYNKKWEFYNNSERHFIYFKNLKEGKSIVGTWYEPSFFKNLSRVLGFRKSIFLPQNSKLIYSNYRYDFKLIK